METPGFEGLNFAVPINYVRGMLEDLHQSMSLDELRASLASPRSDVFKSPGFPAVWKSLTAGKVHTLRFDGDFIYGETVRTDGQPRPDYDSFELRKTQNGGYIGVSRWGFACSYVNYFTGFWSNRCKFEDKMEINSVTPNRIEGRVFTPPDGAVFNCGKCSYSKKPVWTPFVWIPQ